EVLAVGQAGKMPGGFVAANGLIQDRRPGVGHILGADLVVKDILLAVNSEGFVGLPEIRGARFANGGCRATDARRNSNRRVSGGRCVVGNVSRAGLTGENQCGTEGADQRRHQAGHGLLSSKKSGGHLRLEELRTESRVTLAWSKA